eukprot:GHVP01058459.1.p1 GENE.GHVP01058459.1~~GHVP01058459.1.p1  ORF type:complete len:114 (-),score=13.01 GHVP01058459.1:648-989(-)
MDAAKPSGTLNTWAYQYRKSLKNAIKSILNCHQNHHKMHQNYDMEIMEKYFKNKEKCNLSIKSNIEYKGIPVPLPFTYHLETSNLGVTATNRRRRLTLLPVEFLLDQVQQSKS